MAFCSLAFAAQASSFDAVAEFSTASNPAGAWTYGTGGSIAGGISPFELTGPVSGGARWFRHPSFPEQVVFKGAGHPLVLYPASGDFTKVRFTAPDHGKYTISGAFSGVEAATTAVHVVHNDSVLSSGFINGVGSTAPFAVERIMARGDSLDFVVGPNGSHLNDGTGLSVTLTREDLATPTAPAGYEVVNRFENGPLQGGRLVGLAVQPGTRNVYVASVQASGKNFHHGQFTLWQLDMGGALSLVGTYSISGDELVELTFGPDGKLYTGSKGGTVFAIDVATGVASPWANTGINNLHRYGLQFNALGQLILMHEAAPSRFFHVSAGTNNTVQLGTYSMTRNEHGSRFGIQPDGDYVIFPNGGFGPSGQNVVTELKPVNGSYLLRWLTQTVLSDEPTIGIPVGYSIGAIHPVTGDVYVSSGNLGVGSSRIALTPGDEGPSAITTVFVDQIGNHTLGQDARGVTDLEFGPRSDGLSGHSLYFIDDFRKAVYEVREIVASAPPTVGVDQAVVSANEGSTATNTGTWSSSSGPVTISASVGLAVIDGNTWSWSKPVVDGPASTEVTITIDDGTQEATLAFTLHANNVAPTAVILGATSAVEGDALVLGSNVQDPGVLDTFTYQWSVSKNGQQVAVGSGPSLGLTPPDNGLYLIDLTVTDKDGGVGYATHSLLVTNATPVVTSGPSATVQEGSQASFNLGSFVDPGADAPWTVTVDWGDGATETFTLQSAGSLGARSHTYADDGQFTVSVTVRDKDGDEDSASFDVTVENAAPVVTPASSQASNEGETRSFALGSFADAGLQDGPWAVVVDWGDGSAEEAFEATSQGALPNKSHAFPDNGVYTVTIRVTDKDGAEGTATVTVEVANVAPTAKILGPASGLLGMAGSPISFQGEVSDSGVQDLVQAKWVFTSNLYSIEVPVQDPLGTFTTPVSFPEPGVYLAELRAQDKDGGTASATTVLDSQGNPLRAFVVIYDPTAGFVTGGGWVTSPAGALLSSPTATGKATFGFVSRYNKNEANPVGNVEFQLGAANFNFKSSSYEWLILSGNRAQFRGTGTVNGSGNFGVIITVVDGRLAGGDGSDRFRIKIWDRNTGVVVYDNQRGSDDGAPLGNGAILGGGNIVIHPK